MLDLISDEDVAFFRDNGYLKISRVIAGDELRQLQAEALARIEQVEEGEKGCLYGDSTQGNGRVLSRVEYVTNWCDAGRALLGHPGILNTVEKISGPDFVYIGEGMVLKMPGEGVQVNWHRDHGDIWDGQPQNYNVDIYLDDATEENCVWAIPGSNLWDNEKAAAYQGRDVIPGEIKEAVPCVMKAGDILLHDARVIHGSPTTSSDVLRRTIYAWFYSLKALEPFESTPGYQGIRWRHLQQCIEFRKQMAYADGETPYNYRAAVQDEIPEEVSFIYGDHGRWTTGKPNSG